MSPRTQRSRTFAPSKVKNGVPYHQTLLAGRRIAEQFTAVIAVISQLGPDLVAFLHHIENVGGVVAKRRGDEVDITRELLVAAKLPTKGAAKSEVRMEQLRDQALVGVVPQLLEEDADNFLLG